MRELTEVGLVTGEGHLMISCTVRPQCGPNRIFVDTYYTGAFLPDSNELTGTFSTPGVGYDFELGRDGACLTHVWNELWGDSGSHQWRATLEDGAARGFHIEEGEPSGQTFELILSDDRGYGYPPHPTSRPLT